MARNTNGTQAEPTLGAELQALIAQAVAAAMAQQAPAQGAKPSAPAKAKHGTVTVTVSIDGMAVYTSSATPRFADTPKGEFSSGKSGYNASGKLDAPGGERYQLSFNLVRLDA